jgi:hypothetical protein
MTGDSMSTSFFVLLVRSRRDVVLARERARQIAGLLGFDALEQAGIGAAVFEIASRAREQSGRAALQFQAEDGTFRVVPAPSPLRELSAQPSGLRLEKPLPRKEPAVGPEDMAWVVRQLALLAPANVFAEIQRQNQEFLRVLADLQSCRASLAALAPEAARPAA